MKWGLIVRSERDRGLGIQTKAIFDNLKPDRTLVVVNQKSGFESHPEDYPGATLIDLEFGLTKNSLDQQTVRDWWQGLDVVMTVETLYDWDLVEWARADNVATVIQGNPEFWMATNPQPDQWCWPTSWRLRYLPEGPVLPVPVPDIVPVRAPRLGSGEPIKLLHIAGSGAMADRNGTGPLGIALRKISTAKMTVYSQVPVNIRAEVRGPVDDRWSMYENQHVLVLPRRYGGLCLPANEACAAGLALMMTDCSPNEEWPGFKVSTTPGAHIHMQTGCVEVDSINPYILANAIRGLTHASVATAQEQSLEWASQRTWSKLAPSYYELLDGVRTSR